jgi:apolipoprotein D and lipocalin family protein
MPIGRDSADDVQARQGKLDPAGRQAMLDLPMSRPRTTLLPLLALVLGCSARLPPPPTVASVDLGRYSGRWYEVARLPAVFQRACVRSWADYTPRHPGLLGVINTCETANGERRSIHGEARVVDAASNARFLVTFDTWFAWLLPRPAEGNYWILALGPDYDAALVGTPDRRYLWLLARSPALAAGREHDLVGQAQRLGFDTRRLIRDAWPRD